MSEPPAAADPHPLSPAVIAASFVEACRQELAALKPGNVHIHSAGHGMQVGDFERSADAAAPHIATPGARVGARILAAVEATWAAVATNTNLGIVLLCAPLAAAAETIAADETLRSALARVLADLDRQDATDAFKAIALANPAGLGRVSVADVSAPATITLLHAMGLAADRDRISRGYATDFADVFDVALPCLAAARQWATEPDIAVSVLHMTLLSTFDDSHIARKWGQVVAAAVRAEAAAVAAGLPLNPTRNDLTSLHEFDASLKHRGLNPGTTADFVVATLFTEALLRQITLSVSA